MDKSEEKVKSIIKSKDKSLKKLIFRINEVAVLLNTSIPTIRKLVNNGSLQPITLINDSNILYFTSKDIENFIENRMKFRPNIKKYNRKYNNATHLKK